LNETGNNHLVRVIGIGNEFRGDDAAGLRVVRRLEKSGCRGVSFRVLDGEATALMDAMDGCFAVVLVDAVQSGEPPGTVMCWEQADALPLGPALRCSTHAMGLAEALQLARALGRLPQHLAVIGIEGERFDPGTPLSETIERAVPEAAQRLERLLETWPSMKTQ